MYKRQPVDIVNVKIYPNPVSERLMVEATNLGPGLLFQIFNIQGKMELSGDLRNEAVNVAHLPPGLYFLEIKKQDGDILRSRFVKD